MSETMHQNNYDKISCAWFFLPIDKPNRRPFHWPLKYSEVFLREPSGFDAIVGNHPFMGGRIISTTLSDVYASHVRAAVLEGRKRSVNLVLHFALRAIQLAKKDKYLGFITTDSLRDSDSRTAGLEYLLRAARPIYVVSSQPWPCYVGVNISVLCHARRAWRGVTILDGQEVNAISSKLESWAVADESERLSCYGPLCSDGVKIQGAGFMLTKDEVIQLIRDDKRYSEVIWPTIVGDDLNRLLEPQGHRFVVKISNRDEAEAKAYPMAWELVVQRVKPYRSRLNKQVHEDCFWKFRDRREAFFNRVRHRERMLVASKCSKHFAITSGNPRCMYSEEVKVFDASSFAAFSVLQSTLHIVWALHWGSQRGGNPSYVRSRCFDAFPLPAVLWNSAGAPNRLRHSDEDGVSLSKTGHPYFVHRLAVMTKMQWGLTSIYNAMHSTMSTGDAAKLRELCVEKDKAVAAAYGWNDLDLGHSFHETKQGLRYTISENPRRVLLGRLLAQNHQRYEEEVKACLHNKQTSGASVSDLYSGGAKK